MKKPAQEQLYLTAMLDFVQEAGVIAMGLINNSAPGLKKDQTVITKADHAISTLCRKRLAGFLKDPKHLLIDEEDPKVASYLNKKTLAKAKYLWSVDPIDGTRLYANRMPTFGISLGLLKDLKPWLGVVYFPALNELFVADGAHAYFVTQAFLPDEKRVLIKPLDEKISPSSLFFCNDTFYRKFRWVDDDFHVMINPCAVVHLCWPAIGRGMGSFLKSSLWDFAGSWPIMKAAGMEFRRVSDAKVMDRISVDVFAGGAKHWEMNDYYLITSARNYVQIKKRMAIL